MRGKVASLHFYVANGQRLLDFFYNFAMQSFSKRKNMAREERNRIGYMVGLGSEFALRFGVRPRQAYAYLKRYKGLEHLQHHYGVLHTQSFPDTVDVLAQVCQNNGGGLR
jgi:hypothetical protein